MSGASAAATWRLPSRGRAGMIALLVMESAFLGTFVVAYLFYIGKSLSGPTPRQVLEFPILGTACLLASSLTVALAVRALRGGRVTLFAIWLLVTILLGAEFLTGTALEWYGLIVGRGLTVGTNLFGTTFYSLVGFHAGHVTPGVAPVDSRLDLHGVRCCTGRACGTGGAPLLVLALRGCGVDRRIDRRLHREPLRR